MTHCSHLQNLPLILAMLFCTHFCPLQTVYASSWKQLFWRSIWPYYYLKSYVHWPFPAVVVTCWLITIGIYIFTDWLKVFLSMCESIFIYIDLYSFCWETGYIHASEAKVFQTHIFKTRHILVYNYLIFVI